MEQKVPWFTKNRLPYSEKTAFFDKKPDLFWEFESLQKKKVFFKLQNQKMCVRLPNLAQL